MIMKISNILKIIKIVSGGERELKHHDITDQSGGTLTKWAFKQGLGDNLVPRVVSIVQNSLVMCWSELTCD